MGLLNRILNADESPAEKLYQKGLSRLRRGQFDEALRYFEEATGTDPGNGEIGRASCRERV